MSKVISITPRNGYWERLDRRIKEATHECARALIDDAVARVTAAGERVRAELRARKVVDLTPQQATSGLATTTF